MPMPPLHPALSLSVLAQSRALATHVHVLQSDQTMTALVSKHSTICMLLHANATACTHTG